MWIEKIEVVPAPEGKNRKRGPYWRCRCLRCGNENYIATSGDLNSGRIKSCGCYKTSGDPMVKHGHCRSRTLGRSRTWRAWVDMRARCDYPSKQNYKWYGGKSVGYCERWLSFNNFLEDMGECPEGLELDRIDPTGNYEPGNCRWVTHAENMKNLRSH